MFDIRLSRIEVETRNHVLTLVLVKSGIEVQRTPKYVTTSGPMTCFNSIAECA
jgi:hypothetical protein